MLKKINKRKTLSYFFGSMSVFTSLLLGFVASILLKQSNPPSMNELGILFFLGIPAFLILLFYATSVYLQKPQKSMIGKILIGLGYAGMMLSFFFMWYTNLLTAISQAFILQSFTVQPLYSSIFHSVLFLWLSLMLGWLYGKKTLVITVLLIFVYIYTREMGTFRMTYCQYLDSISSPKQYKSFPITKEEERYMKFYLGSTIDSTMREQIKCEKSFPLNFLINKADQTYSF